VDGARCRDHPALRIYGPEQVLGKEARKFVYRKEGSAPPTGAGACCQITDAPAQKDGNPGGALLVPSDRAGRMRGKPIYCH
jgi:hypothetical protein